MAYAPVHVKQPIGIHIFSSILNIYFFFTPAEIGYQGPYVNPSLKYEPPKRGPDCGPPNRGPDCGPKPWSTMRTYF